MEVRGTNFRDINEAEITETNDCEVDLEEKARWFPVFKLTKGGYIPMPSYIYNAVSLEKLNWEVSEKNTKEENV